MGLVKRGSDLWMAYQTKLFSIDRGRWGAGVLFLVSYGWIITSWDKEHQARGPVVK
jgi:hypothetical protein